MTTNYYHVTDLWDGWPLESLYDRYGEGAYEMYAKKWPDSANLAQVHAHVVHLHSTLRKAWEYQQEYGGEILRIDGTGLDIEMDSYEYPHPVCKEPIPVNSITILGGGECEGYREKDE